MPATFNIPDHIVTILRDATLYIPDKPSPANLYTLKLNGQLDRKDYVAVMKVIEGAGGKWVKRKGLHEFRDDPSEVLGLAMETGKGVNLQQQFQSFYTPAHIADRMVELLPAGMKRLLEPSCGEGSLVRAVRKVHPDIRIVAVDINDKALAKIPVEYNTIVLQGDFLSINPDFGERFDAICMNPPFTKGQDAKHVNHALDFLKPGGVLVAIMTPNAMNKVQEPYRSLCLRLKAECMIDEATPLPSGTFKDTDIETLMVRITKK
jgi:type I restriction-modification system DNA methylase subunit